MIWWKLKSAHDILFNGFLFHLKTKVLKWCKRPSLFLCPTLFPFVHTPKLLPLLPTILAPWILLDRDSFLLLVSLCIYCSLFLEGSYSRSMWLASGLCPNVSFIITTCQTYYLKLQYLFPTLFPPFLFSSTAILTTCYNFTFLIYMCSPHHPRHWNEGSTGQRFL